MIFGMMSNVPFWETLFGNLCDFGVSFGLQLDSIWRIGGGSNIYGFSMGFQGEPRILGSLTSGGINPVLGPQNSYHLLPKANQRSQNS